MTKALIADYVGRAEWEIELMSPYADSIPYHCSGIREGYLSEMFREDETK